MISSDEKQCVHTVYVCVCVCVCITHADSEGLDSAVQQLN